MTFTSTEKSRGCSEFGGYSLTRTETVHESGRVDWRVKGHSQDDGTINESGTREHGPLDLAVVEAARLRSGWIRTA